jgi:hypothetical protein
MAAALDIGEPAAVKAFLAISCPDILLLRLRAGQQVDAPGIGEY